MPSNKKNITTQATPQDATSASTPAPAPFTLGKLSAAVDRLAPYRLAYDWDNVGLQIGDPEQPVSRVLVALEVQDSTIACARELACDAIISHHPLIFRPAKRLRADELSGRLAIDLIRADIGLIAAHTNLDRVLCGTNGALAALLGLRDPVVVEPTENDQLYKFTVFVPRDHTAKIIDAIHRGGGGHIGRYSHCTFRSPGTGTFVPEYGSHPTLGRIGELEQTDEDRLETVVDSCALRSVLQEVRQAHPFEEVAFDVFPLHDAAPKFGLGAAGTLPAATTLRALAATAAAAVGAPFATFAGDASMPVRKVAVLTGSAGPSVLTVSRSIADVIVTGELTYHFAVEAKARGMGVICIGHAPSERIFAQPVINHLSADPFVRSAGITFEPFEDFPEPFQLAMAPAAASVSNVKRKTK